MSAVSHDPVWTQEGSIPRFGAIARHARSSRRLSQNALAAAAALSSSTVRGWEAGRSEPSMPEFVRWSRALGFSEAMLAAVRATLLAPRAWADRPGVGIGPYLRERRLADRTTLTRAAAELGLPLATLGHYESGRVEVPSVTLASIVERFGVTPVERAALCDGPSAFLEWCDGHVVSPEKAARVLTRAAWAVSPEDLRERGPTFVRLRTALLRVRIRGEGWNECAALAAGNHALWLATVDRRTEAAVALSAISPEGASSGTPHAAAVLATRRLLGRVRADELLVAAAAAPDAARAAWLRSEAALDLCERRRPVEARAHAERAKVDVASGPWPEAWMRCRDAARVHLRLRDWDDVGKELDAMRRLEEPAIDPQGWYVRQREALAGRLAAQEPNARPVGA